MKADSHVSRGSALIGAVRLKTRRTEVSSWLAGSWAVDHRESGRVLVYGRECINRRCILCNVTP